MVGAVHSALICPSALQFTNRHNAENRQTPDASLPLVELFNNTLGHMPYIIPVGDIGIFFFH